MQVWQVWQVGHEALLILVFNLFSLFYNAAKLLHLLFVVVVIVVVLIFLVIFNIVVVFSFSFPIYNYPAQFLIFIPCSYCIYMCQCVRVSVWHAALCGATIEIKSNLLNSNCFAT